MLAHPPSNSTDTLLKKRRTNDFIKNLKPIKCMKKFQCKILPGALSIWKSKVFRAMKLTLLALLLGVFQTYAIEAYAQNAKLNLNARGQSVKDVLHQIEENSEFFFLYNSKLVDVDRLVDISGSDLNINQVLDQLFASNNVAYNIIDRQIVLSSRDLPATSAVNQQQRSVSGRITDRGGLALPGVTVLVKGTSMGTITDMSGNYTIGNLPANATLVFSFVGMRAQEVVVGNQTTINVMLEDETIGLEEVVAVGYGVQRKSDLTGSISVATSDDILRAPSFNALQGLRGKAAGVNIFNNSGSPTGTPRVIIRGIGTINTTSNPLYVVDGVVMENFQLVNPNDIERIEVLKDASATAIYGARGANGVILVTTKRGYDKEGVIVSYNGFASVGTMARKMELLNAEEYMQVMEIGTANASKYNPTRYPVSPVLDRSNRELFDASGRPLYDTDWQDESTRTAYSNSHQLSIQQGGKSSSSGFFVNYSDMQGLMLNSYLKRVNSRMTFDSKVKDWLSVGMNVMVNKVWGNEAEETGGHQMPRRTMIEMIPILPVKFPDGRWSYNADAPGYGNEGMANPVHVLTTQERNRFRTQIFGNAALTFHLAKGLDLKTQFGIDNQHSKDANYSPTDLRNISYPNGSASISNVESLYWQEETYLTYDKVVDNHRFNAVLGLSWQERTFNSHGSSTSGFSDDFYKYNNLGVGTNPSTPSSSYNRWAMNSYFVRVSEAFKNRYLLTVTARVDGSSKFGKNNKYAFFPSSGLGWIISNESFMQESQTINNLKLHASYGLTGNSELATYQSLGVINAGTTLINGTRASSTFVNNLANPDLKWEKTAQFDIGINLGLWNNKLMLDADYYHKKTTDLLLAKPLPRTTGFNSVMYNIGSVQNQGMDLMVTSRNVERANFEWSTTVNANYNQNKILQLGDNNEDILLEGWVSGNIILRVGEPLGSYYGYRRLGIWGTDEAAEAAKVGAKPGEAKRSTDREILGNGLPDWTGSFINNFRYKNFDFTADLQFVIGGSIIQQYYHSTEDRTGLSNSLKTVLYEAWTPTNQNTMVQELRNAGVAGVGQNSRADDRWVADASYLRGNLFALGYTVDKSRMAGYGISNLRLYVSVDNAFVVDSKDFQGFDPEATSGTSLWSQNVFFFQYPKPRTFTFGVNVSF